MFGARVQTERHVNAFKAQQPRSIAHWLFTVST